MIRPIIEPWSVLGYVREPDWWRHRIPHDSPAAEQAERCAVERPAAPLGRPNAPRLLASHRRRSSVLERLSARRSMRAPYGRTFPWSWSSPGSCRAAVGVEPLGVLDRGPLARETL